MAHGDITHIDIPVSDLTKAAGFYSTWLPKLVATAH